MAYTRRRVSRPGVEELGTRIVLSTSNVISAFHPMPGTQPSADRNRAFTPADLQAYAGAYETRIGDAGFLQQYDFNGAGFIGQNDATPILRGLAAITPVKPLKLTLKLAPGEQVAGHHPSDNGGVTRLGTVTVIGHTTPNSIIFLDGPTTPDHASTTGNFKFEGGAIASDANGDFRYTVVLSPLSHSGSLTGTNYLIRTPFNQQLIRAFPILRIK